MSLSFFSKRQSAYKQLVEIEDESENENDRATNPFREDIQEQGAANNNSMIEIEDMTSNKQQQNEQYNSTWPYYTTDQSNPYHQYYQYPYHQYSYHQYPYNQYSYNQYSYNQYPYQPQNQSQNIDDNNNRRNRDERKNFFGFGKREGHKPIYITALFIVTIIILLFTFALSLLTAGFVGPMGLLYTTICFSAIFALWAIYIVPCGCYPNAEWAMQRIRVFSLVAAIFDIIGSLTIPSSLFSAGCPDDDEMMAGCADQLPVSQGVALTASVFLIIHMCLCLLIRLNAKELVTFKFSNSSRVSNDAGNEDENRVPMVDYNTTYEQSLNPMPQIQNSNG